MNAYNMLAQYYDLLYGNENKISDECDFLENVFHKFCKQKPVDVLDIGCGTGSHSIVLANRNYKMAGIDQSKNMIEEAKRKSQNTKNFFFKVQNMKEINFTKKFDCAFCIFNSFGYLTNNSDLNQFFSNLHKNLKANALFILEFWNISGIKASPYKNWTKKENDELVLYRIEETKLELETNLLESKKEFIITKGNEVVDNFKETHTLRCYTILEIQELLQKNNFQLLAFVDFDRKHRNKLKKPNEKTLRVLAIAKN